MVKKNLVREHPRKAAATRQPAFEKAAKKFPPLFLTLINAQTVRVEQYQELADTLAFGYSQSSRTLLTSGSSETVDRGYKFSEDELAEQEQLCKEIKRRSPSYWFWFEPADGRQHLSVLPILVLRLREVANWIIAGQGINRLSFDYIAAFRRRIDLLPRDPFTADIHHTIVNCEHAADLLTRFVQLPAESRRLLYRCENPECGRYDLRARRDKRHCLRTCTDRHRYLVG